MHNITISTTFHSGRGFLSFVIYRNGHEYRRIVINESGDSPIILEDGLYLFSGTGVSPDGGTDLSFNTPTIPKTPCKLSAGPIFKSFSMDLTNTITAPIVAVEQPKAKKKK